MKSKTRFRLLIIFAVTAAAAGAFGGFILYRQQVVKKRNAEWRAEGMKAFEAKDYPNALNNLIQYLPTNEKDKEALFALARTRLLLEEPTGRYLYTAAGLFGKVIDLDPGNEEARRTLLKLDDQLNRYTEALTIAESILASNPKDLEALRVKSTAQMGLRKFDDARATNEKILEIDPLNLKSQDAILWLMSQKNGVVAQNFIDYANALAGDKGKFPKNPAAELIASTAFQIALDDASAKKYALQAASRPSMDSTLLHQIANQLDKLGLRDDATKVFQARAADANPTVESRRDWAWRLFYLNRLPEVVEYLNNLNVADPLADADTMAIKAFTYNRLGRQQDAINIIKIMRSKTDANPRALLWGRLLDASILDQNDQTNDRFLDITSAGTAGLADNALAYELIADAISRRGFRDKALELWINKSADLAPAWADPLVHASRYEFNKEHWEPAFRLADAARQRLPDDPDVMVAFALAFSKGINPTDKPALRQFLAYIAKVDAVAPLNPQMLPLKVLVYSALGQKDDALKVIDQALQISPPLAEADLIQLAHASFQAQLGQDEKILTASEKAHGLSAWLAYEQALVMYENKLPTEGLAYFEEQMKGHSADETHPRITDLQWQMAHATYMDAIHEPRAVEAWTLLADTYKDNPLVLWNALNSHALFDKMTVRDRLLTQLESLPTAGGTVKLYRARWLLDTDSPQTATAERIKNLQHADTLLTEFINLNPRFVEARIEHARNLKLLDALQHPGMPPQLKPAIDEAKAALLVQPGNVGLTIVLADLLVQQGDFTTVPELLHPIFSKDSKASDDQKRAAAALLNNAGKPEDGIQFFESLPAITSSADALLLARLYGRKGQVDKVDSLIKTILQGTDPTGIFFVAQFYAATGRKPLALETLKLVDKTQLTASERSLGKAQFYMNLGDFKTAEGHILQAITENPSDPIARRQLILYRMLQSDTKGTEEAIRTAAKEIRDDKIIQQAYENIDTILPFVSIPGLQGLVTSVVRDPALSAGSIEALQIVRHARETREPLSATAQKLARVVDAHPGNITLQVAMIQLYASCGRMADARAVADRAIQAFPNATEPVKAAVEAMLAFHQWDDVIALANEWKRRDPDVAPDADLQIADASIFLKKPDQALAVLKPYIALAQADADHHIPFVVDYVRALLLAGRYDEARAIMRPLNQRNIRWCEITLMLIAQSTITDEKVAADWMNELDPLLPAGSGERADYAKAWYNLYTTYHNPEFSNRARALLEEIAARDNVPNGVLTTLGVVYDILGDPKNAEIMYGRALQANSSDPLAANNLAMIYASRGSQLNDALDLVNRAIKIAPNFATFHDTKSVVLTKRGDISGALEEAANAVMIDPQDVDLQLSFLNLQITAGKTKEAQDTLRDIDARPPATLTSPQKTRLATLRALVH